MITLLVQIFRDKKKSTKKSTIFHLSDLDWADIKVVYEIVMAFKLAQETLEGEVYITGSRVVAILEKIRTDLILTRLEWADSVKGTRVLTSVIEGFETRFGDGSNVCEVDCEIPFSPTSWLHQGESIDPTCLFFSLACNPFLSDLCARNPFLASLVLSCLSHFLQRLYTLNSASATDVSVWSLSLPLYLPLLTVPDRGYLSGYSECSESPWYPPKRGRSSLEACQRHVGGAH